MQDKERGGWNEPPPQIGRFLGMSARSDNGHPDNGTERNEDPFIVPIVDSAMKNSAG